jgi:hypothetical protein
MISANEVRIVPESRPEDLARAIAGLEHTLSEVLVLLYHVVQANQTLIDHLQRQNATAPVASTLPLGHA